MPNILPGPLDIGEVDANTVRVKAVGTVVSPVGSPVTRIVNDPVGVAEVV